MSPFLGDGGPRVRFKCRSSLVPGCHSAFPGELWGCNRLFAPLISLVISKSWFVRLVNLRVSSRELGLNGEVSGWSLDFQRRRSFPGIGPVALGSRETSRILVYPVGFARSAHQRLDLLRFHGRGGDITSFLCECFHIKSTLFHHEPYKKVANVD